MSDLGHYTPDRWHWRIAGESRFWSSGDGAWVDAAPAGACVTSIASIEDLDVALRQHGLISPLVKAGDFEDALQEHVDAQARARGYRDGFALAGYATSTIPAWAAEAAAFIAWRDAVWAYAYAELAKVQAGERAQPSITEIVTELPSIAWPA